MSLRFGLAVGALAAALPLCSFAQTPAPGSAPQTTVSLSPPLLPASFGVWKTAGTPSADLPEPTFSLVNANKAALEECDPERSAVQTYTGPGGDAKPLHVEAVEFKDASGALAAFSVVSQPGMHELKDLGTRAAAGEGGVLFTTGAALAVAFPASAADLPALKALAELMPKPVGSKALQPLLPALLPARGLAPVSLRYALGARTYMAEGGVLPAAGLGWDKSAEALTAKYADRRGAETLTLLLYPTPTIAGPHVREIEAQLAGLGSSFANAKARREGSLVILANGTFSADAAQALVENTHLRQLATTDKAMVTPEVVETRKTFGLLASTIAFSGIACLVALMVGVFLGGGRALVRILQGKPAATEAEFLSLHLDPQNAAPRFSVNKPGEHA